MRATVSRPIALRELAVEHAAVRALTDALTPEEMLLPDTVEYGLYSDQHLSFKDLLAHLVTYEAMTVAMMAAWARGIKHPGIEAMRDYRESVRIHYGGIAERRDLPLPQVLDEAETTRTALMQAIRDTSDEAWHAPFPTEPGLDLGGAVEIILVAPPRPPYRHLPVHVPDCDAYIRKLKRLSGRAG